MVNLRKVVIHLLVLPFVFLLSSTSVFGQEGCIVPTVPGHVEGIETWLAFQWDPANPDTMQLNTSVKVNVIGGSLPLGWSISGNGFSLGEAQTNDRTNTLIASPTACGTATIEVIEKDGLAITGYVRSTAGQWINTGDHVCRPPCKAAKGGGGRPWCGYERFACISGNIRYCYVFCPSPCQWHCPPEICIECGHNYYYRQEWICP